jgi:hypothetical protein
MYIATIDVIPGNINTIALGACLIADRVPEGKAIEKREG